MGSYKKLHSIHCYISPATGIKFSSFFRDEFFWYCSSSLCLWSVWESVPAQCLFIWLRPEVALCGSSLVCCHCVAFRPKSIFTWRCNWHQGSVLAESLLSPPILYFTVSNVLTLYFVTSRHNWLRPIHKQNCGTMEPPWQWWWPALLY